MSLNGKIKEMVKYLTLVGYPLLMACWKPGGGLLIGNLIDVRGLQ